MATQKSKVICPKCGNEMNHHADKLVYALDHGGAKQPDPGAGLGGMIEETHCCPGCGAVESHRVDESSKTRGDFQ
jgi:predicted RNA-binding Zn-ribbon protein involved in translation (DUF1610 family)